MGTERVTMSKVFTVFKVILTEESKRPIDLGAGVALQRARSRSLGLSLRGSPFRRSGLLLARKESRRRAEGSQSPLLSLP